MNSLHVPQQTSHIAIFPLVDTVPSLLVSFLSHFSRHSAKVFRKALTKHLKLCTYRFERILCSICFSNPSAILNPERKKNTRDSQLGVAAVFRFTIYFMFLLECCFSCGLCCFHCKYVFARLFSMFFMCVCVCVCVCVSVCVCVCVRARTGLHDIQQPKMNND